MVKFFYTTVNKRDTKTYEYTDFRITMTFKLSSFLSAKADTSILSGLKSLWRKNFWEKLSKFKYFQRQ